MDWHTDNHEAMSVFINKNFKGTFRTIAHRDYTIDCPEAHRSPSTLKNGKSLGKV